MNLSFLLSITVGGFLLYLLLYIAYLFLSVAADSYRMCLRDRMRKTRIELKHDYYFPVSVLVPACNNEGTILGCLESLLALDYRLYEIVVVDDGSQDNTSQIVIDHFHMHKVARPIRKSVLCQEQEGIYESDEARVKLTLVRKKQGGKGDALNMGINAAQFPYYLCVDPESMLQKDALERMAQRVMEDDSVVAVGGLVHVAQCIHMEKGEAGAFRLSGEPLLWMQVMEHARLLAARSLLDILHGNLILSSEFALFRKDVVIAAGGYDTNVLRADMELIMRLHRFCRNNQRSCSVCYETSAVCWRLAPTSVRELVLQRRRRHLGLFQSIFKHRSMFLSPRFGLMGSVSYLYYLLYELFSPQIQILGLAVTAVAAWGGLLNVPFMIRFFLLYAVYGAILTITAFFQRIYTQNLRISTGDTVKACLMCLVENIFFRFFLDFVCAASFIGCRRRKNQ